MKGMDEKIFEALKKVKFSFCKFLNFVVQIHN